MKDIEEGSFAKPANTFDCSQTFSWVTGIVKEHRPNADDQISLLISRYMIEDWSPLTHRHKPLFYTGF